MKREGWVGFNARLPLDVDEWIEAQARANCRSKNAEIAFRLKAAMAAEQPVSRATGTPAAEQASQA